MIHSRQAREQLEEQHLAPWAAKSAVNQGRVYAEPAHEYRTEFQRDRDRILYSPCFRRLEYKTQVFINGTADHYRTRLTHTLEMTAIGRTIARSLRANEDLVETIAMAHDIGHSPFGHVGERELDQLMLDHGGFDHNIQSLRWVEHLEQRYPQYPGLNLTWEVRSGLRKHQAAEPGALLDGLPIGPFQMIEAQIADVADDIAYHAHDVEDGVEAGLLSMGELKEIAAWQKAEERAMNRVPGLSGDVLLQATIRYLLDMQVEDVIHLSLERFARHAPQSPEDVMRCPERIVTFSDEMNALLGPHREFLSREVYWHPAVAAANSEAVQMMKRLFLYYIDCPESMGSKARSRVESEGLWRTACDYVSGMTDRYAMEEYLRFGLDQG